MANIFNVRSARRDDPSDPRCAWKGPYYGCHLAVQVTGADGVDRCGYHDARQTHEAHRVAAARPGDLLVDPVEGCWFCPEAGSEVARIHEMRLAEIEQLEDGWYDGHGLAPTPVALTEARRLLVSTRTGGIGLSLCANDEGGIAVEDVSDPLQPGELMLDVDPDGTYVLFMPMIPSDEHDPAYADGMKFTDPSQLWCYTATARAALRAQGIEPRAWLNDPAPAEPEPT